MRTGKLKNHRKGKKKAGIKTETRKHSFGKRWVQGEERGHGGNVEKRKRKKNFMRKKSHSLSEGEGGLA